MKPRRTRHPLLYVCVTYNNGTTLAWKLLEFTGGLQHHEFWGALATQCIATAIPTYKSKAAPIVHNQAGVPPWCSLVGNPVHRSLENYWPRNLENYWWPSSRTVIYMCHISASTIKEISNCIPNVRTLSPPHHGLLVALTLCTLRD